jgi:hypothetical protein
VIVLAREHDEVHLHDPQTKNEHFWLGVWVNCYFEKLHYRLETASGPQGAPGYLKCPRNHWQ